MTRLITLVELRGLEPLTPCMPCRCATSCATAPRSSRTTDGILANAGVSDEIGVSTSSTAELSSQIVGREPELATLGHFVEHHPAAVRQPMQAAGGLSRPPEEAAHGDLEGATV